MSLLPLSRTAQHCQIHLYKTTHTNTCRQLCHYQTSPQAKHHTPDFLRNISFAIPICLCNTNRSQTYLLTYYKDVRALTVWHQLLLSQPQTLLTKVIDNVLIVVNCSSTLNPVLYSLPSTPQHGNMAFFQITFKLHQY